MAERPENGNWLMGLMQTTEDRTVARIERLRNPGRRV
jgi:hypothetical protein